MSEVPAQIGKWKPIRALGSGGQGTVYCARPLEAERARKAIAARISKDLRALNNPSDRHPEEIVESVLELTARYSAPERPDQLAAVKQFHAFPAGQESKALGRLKLEIEALTKVMAPGIIKLLDHDIDTRHIVTEYHPGGTLEDPSNRFVGNGTAALRAWRPLVAAVAEVHNAGYVHRDIKPANILIAEDGRLVLGDFGIAFYDGHDKTRLTEEFEKVGSSHWIPQWAMTGWRLDDAKPNLDIYALGKVLWAMVSGRRTLQLWYWSRPGNNLEQLFPEDRAAKLINRILAKTVVEEEADCLNSAGELLVLVDAALAQLSVGGDYMTTDRPCRVCGRGHYKQAFPTFDQRLLPVAAPEGIDNVRTLLAGQNAIPCRAYLCEKCGHVQLFHLLEREHYKVWDEDSGKTR